MFYASQLRCKYSHSSMQHLKVAYNDSYRVLHGLPRNTGARKLQIQDGIVIFDALLHKSMFGFLLGAGNQIIHLQDIRLTAIIF